MRNSCHESRPRWIQSSGGFWPVDWKKLTRSFYILRPESKLESPKENSPLCPLYTGTDSGNAFLLDIWFSCSMDISLNRKINILDMETKIDLTYQPVFWISNQINNILNRQSRIQNKNPLTFWIISSGTPNFRMPIFHINHKSGIQGCQQEHSFQACQWEPLLTFWMVNQEFSILEWQDHNIPHNRWKTQNSTFQLRYSRCQSRNPMFKIIHLGLSTLEGKQKALSSRTLLPSELCGWPLHIRLIILKRVGYVERNIGTSLGVKANQLL